MGGSTAAPGGAAEASAPETTEGSWSLMPSRPHKPPAQLIAEKVTGEFAWAKSSLTSLSESSSDAMRSGIRSTREGVQSAVGAMESTRNSFETSVTDLTTPSETTAGYKRALLDFRSRFSGLLVGAVAAASIVPAVRQRNPRILLRNLLIGGGGAAVLLWPELVLRTAPYVSQATSSVARRVGGNDSTE